MKDFLEQHQITLTARGPVFVGSGKEIMKKEYLFLAREKKVEILDMGKLYQMVRQKGRSSRFEQFFMGGNRQTLYNWLEREQLLSAARSGCLNYALDMDPASEVRGPMTIMEFMRDAYGDPYVPGTTLKGMFRGILATKQLLKDGSLRSVTQRDLSQNISRPANRQFYLSKVSQSLEGRIFRKLNRKDTRPTDAVNDIMSGFVVSDSSPIDRKNLVLAQKVEYHTTGETKTLNLWRESLRPGTKITFTVTIHRDIFPDFKEALLQAIESFDDAYNQNFLCAFKRADPLVSPQVFVGGGAGFVSKTLLYPLMGKQKGVESAIEIFKQTRVPPKHGHHKDRGLGVSPHILKCTRYNGRTLQMGLCDFTMS